MLSGPASVREAFELRMEQREQDVLAAAETAPGSASRTNAVAVALAPTSSGERSGVRAYLPLSPAKPALPSDSQATAAGDAQSSATHAPAAIEDEAVYDFYGETDAYNCARTAARYPNRARSTTTTRWPFEPLR